MRAEVRRGTLLIAMAVGCSPTAPPVNETAPEVPTSGSRGLMTLSEDDVACALQAKDEAALAACDAAAKP